MYAGPPNGCGPNVAKTNARPIGTVTNFCDASGNITQTAESSGTRTAIYDSTSRPLFISRSHNARFVCGPDGSRVTEEFNNSAGSRILTRGPAGSEREAAASSCRVVLSGAMRCSTRPRSKGKRPSNPRSQDRRKRNAQSCDSGVTSDAISSAVR